MLCGGGALLEGMAEIAEQIFDVPVRRGYPIEVGGLTDHVNSPSFATGVGLVKFAHRSQMQEPGRALGVGSFAKMADRFRGLFKNLF